MVTARTIISGISLSLALSAASDIRAQGATPPPDPAVPIALEMVKHRAEEMKTSSGLDETTKTALAEYYRKTISNLETAKAYADVRRRFETDILTSEAEAESLRAELNEKRLKSDGLLPDIDSLTLDQIEQALQKEKANQISVEAKLSEYLDQLEKEKARPVDIRVRLAEAETEKDKAESELATSPPTDEDPEIAQARRWWLESRTTLRRAEILMLDQELLSQPPRLELLRAKRNLAEFNLELVRDRVGELETAANLERRKETEEAKSVARAAEREAAGKHGLVVKLAAENTRLSVEIDELAKAIDTINSREAEAADQHERLQDSFKTTRQKIEIVGLSHVLGQVLQEQRRTLPDTRQFRKRARDREKKIAETALSHIQLEEEEKALRDLSGYVANLTKGIAEDVRTEIDEELIALADSRNSLIEKAMGIQNAYLQAMGELDFTERRLQDTVLRFDAFLDKRLLWIRSARPVSPETARLIPSQIADLFSVDHWKNLVNTFVHQALRSPWVAIALILFLALHVRRRRFKKSLLDTGKDVGKLTRDRLSHTLRAFGYVALLALPWPLLLYAVGIELRSSLEADDFTKVVGTALIILTTMLAGLLTLRLIAAPRSIAEIHFNWRERGVKRLYRDLTWFTPALVVTAFLTIITLRSSGQAWATGLGRLSFIVVMVVFTVFFYRLAKPNGGTLSVLFSGNQQSRLFRYRYVWFFLLVTPPIAAAFVSLAGYLYTAGTLIDHIMRTIWFTVMLIVIHQFILRALLLYQRQLRLEAARAKRRAEQEARAASESDEDKEGVEHIEVTDSEVDLQALDNTSRKLLNNLTLFAGIISIWAIWKNVMPAFRIFDDITLWSYTKTVAGIDEQIPITLGSIGLALIILIVTIIATRQLPAFLEVIFLKQMTMAPGSRYTILTLTKYTIVAVGIAWVFSTLGGSWSEIQWIFAALGVGIGFGLQEIVANFISGLIILFERPIRVGDVVTVGTTDGVVTRIRIRATTIRNWDRKELLVPNKNFITQELLNWSLSDQTTRLLIEVGVAYGSDVQRALLILEEVADDHPRVLEDPAPFVVFDQFGDSALLLSLRCYIDDLDYRIRTISDLNLAINQRMNEAGIEISFPQRDIHLDTSKPLDIRLQRTTPPTTPSAES